MGRVIGTGVAAVAVLGCGLLFLLVLAPRQKMEARRLERLPLMDVQSVSAAAAGDEILITGALEGERLPQAGDYIAYRLEEWDVSLPDPDDTNNEPDGSWDTLEVVVPRLQLSLPGGQIPIHADDRVKLSGPLREEWVYSTSSLTAEFDDEQVPDGTRRYLGIYNGDLVTVWGQRASAGGVVPDEIFVGDRVAFIDKEHSAARGMLIAGISMLVCSPVILVGGVLSALFGRNR
jgi:hypothetical protein